MSPFLLMAGWTRLELATSAVTGRRSNQLNYHPAMNDSQNIFLFFNPDCKFFYRVSSVEFPFGKFSRNPLAKKS